MIVNARMYSINPEAAALWRELLGTIGTAADLPLAQFEHHAPAPLKDLWARPDKAAVFMCGLPFSLTRPAPLLIAAPVPSPPEFGGEAHYWSDFVVRADSEFRSVESTFGHRLAFTVPDSQSGWAAAASYFSSHAAGPLFAELVGPTVSPLGALRSVIDGAAEIAPLDAYAFRLLCRYRPDLTCQVRIVGSTPPTPIPALVASPEAANAAQIEALRSAFGEAHRTAAASLMERLLLQRFVVPSAESYASLAERYAAANAHWQSHPLAALVPPGLLR